MAELLVSVRSAKEARTALLAGAGLIDAKAPERGPLGACEGETWLAIARVVSGQRPISAALGEWHEWAGMPDEKIRERLADLDGFTYAKLGPAAMGQNGVTAYGDTLRRLQALGPEQLHWIAVVYADAVEVRSEAEMILQVALASGCGGLLIDTQGKGKPNHWGENWLRYVRRAQKNGLKLAMAGGMNGRCMKRLSCLGVKPAWFAVRGAACRGGKRENEISYGRISRLRRHLS